MKDEVRAVESGESMKRLLIAAALALSACNAQEPAQPARIEALTPDATNSSRFCTSDGVWCVEASEGAPAVAQHVAEDDLQTFVTLPAEEGRGVWPSIIRYTHVEGGEGVIVGFTETQSTMYSGGGAQATQVALYVLGRMPTTAPSSAFVAPLSSSLNIRACFSEADVRARRDACSDDYSFEGTLALADGASTNGPPPLTLTTQATTFPGQRSRTTDSTQAPPLSEADLVRWSDPTCSYTRTLTFDAASGVYTPNEPLPACSDYLEP
jgi:hypothetical protein